MKYAFSYMECLEDTYSDLEDIKPKTGSQVQDLTINDTDDSELTKRERLIILLPVIKYEIEHDMLTPECKEELDIYYEEFTNGEFDGLLDESEADIVKQHLYECYNKVFGKNE